MRRDAMDMNIVLSGGFLLLVGLAAGKLANLLKFPAVTGYLVAGIVVGPPVLNLLTHDLLRASIWISHGALALIAFSIGSEFTIDNIRRLGTRVLVIATLEALGGATAVFLATRFGFHRPTPEALLFGAIAAATAPAATIMVIRELRARGPMTDTLLAVVAIDDPICVMIFGVASGIATMLIGDGSLSLGLMILRPIAEILSALGMGIAAGILAVRFMTKMRDRSETQVLMLGTILGTAGLAIAAGLSPLLACMALGSTVGNLSRRSDALFAAVRALDTPVYVVFFVLSGAGLHVELLRSVGLLGIGYVVFRVAGKIAGAAAGGVLTRAPAVVRKYLGFGLVPQAGVALGLSLLVKQQFPGLGDMISTTIVASTVIYELIGPVFSKMGIALAGEAGAAADESV
ncbi:MAG: cation:proton antiporter [Bacillota bacterium]|nr:cation:proton antiporter [Bacillota bacterium]